MTTRTLIILDGVGIRNELESNAFAAAETPTLDALLKMYPNSQIETSGLAVGLPSGQMGNSEVGHMNLGAGRIVYQSLTRINKAIEDETLAANERLKTLMSSTVGHRGAIHIMGLLSDGGVHSHIDQIAAMARIVAKHGIEQFYIHAFLDGRDTPPKSAAHFIEQMESVLRDCGKGRIATVMGRYYALDRDNRWSRVELAHQLVLDGQGEYQANTAADALIAAYERGETDEFVKPTIVGELAPILPEDAVIFMNFRPDRARELTQSLISKEFEPFERARVLAAESVLTLTRYSDDISCPCIFETEPLRNSLGEYLADQGKRQLRIAETEKYAHVTFFFNGGREEPFSGEDRILVPSPNVASYDLQPEMSAVELTVKLVEAIKSKKFDLVVCNYANGDMVGHTGNFDAAVRAVEALDTCLAHVTQATLEIDGECLITADHGNVEQMLDPESGQAHTAHTQNPVPLILVGRNAGKFGLENGSLCDIAPTLLDMMGIQQPMEMEGSSLLRKHS
ncbi:2,3-bisphosphoglycerate-independent phosphoglycerate mutase [Pseudomonas sp. DWRC2-2]|uniref:2,3-bisphosphoglycerate-independent phosphoglycerate mutase n=1 Tax=Pseudomonas sp. DWRC2-2 TaxID=2804567 RepID=UPI003CF18935